MILCSGEALIDMLPRELAGGGEGFLPVPGGAIFNTALSLGRLGHEAGFFSSVSTDMFGDQLVDFLGQSNVNTSLCVRSEKPTTLAFVKLTDGQAEYSFFDENSAGRSLERSQLPKLSSEVEAIHFGAISLIPEPCGDAYEAFMGENTDKVISLDPNIRQGFITHPEKHRQRIDRMIEMSDIVKVSDEDIEWIVEGASGGIHGAIDAWIEKGVSIVLLSEGSKGATAFTANGSVQQPAPKVEVVDTIGAGDTFNAGFLAGLKDSGLLDKEKLANAGTQALKPALLLAAQVAAKTVSKAGANPPWKDELEG